MGVSGSSRGADWPSRCRELKQAVSLGINSSPPIPPTGQETHGNYKIKNKKTTQSTHRDHGGGKVIHPDLFKNTILSFTFIPQQQSSAFSSTKGNKICGACVGVTESMTASIRSANNVMPFYTELANALLTLWGGMRN